MIKNKICVLIPALNEARNIGPVIKEIKELHLPLHIIVLDDGSTDTTAQVATQSGTKVLRTSRNIGLCNTVARGLKYVAQKRYSFMVQLDADYQHNPRTIPALLNKLHEGADYVVASRYIKKHSPSTSLIRRLGTQCISIGMRLATGTKIYDPTSGYKAMNRKTFMYLSRTYPKHFPEPEILLSLIQRKFTIIEVPSQMRHRLFGSSTISLPKAFYLMGFIASNIFMYGIKRFFSTVFASHQSLKVLCVHLIVWNRNTI